MIAKKLSMFGKLFSMMFKSLRVCYCTFVVNFFPFYGGTRCKTHPPILRGNEGV